MPNKGKWIAAGKKYQKPATPGAPAEIDGNIEIPRSEEAGIKMQDVNNIYGEPVDARLAIYYIKKLWETVKPDESNSCVALLDNSFGFTIDKSLLLQTLSQPSCEGIRFYLAMRDNTGEGQSLPGVLTLVTVGVDSNGKDLNFKYNRDIPFVDDLPDVENLSLTGEYPRTPPAIADKSNPDSPGLEPYVLYQYARLAIQKDNQNPTQG
jgi:hypothetical protein